MSWDAHLEDDRGHVEGDWNYTHNTSCMFYAVIREAGIDLPHDPTPCWSLPRTDDGKLTHYPNGRGSISWWKHLDGMSGPEGAAYLNTIIVGMEADPERFRAMNPENGWGDYDSVLDVLREMRAAVPEWPTTWHASG